jgi:hypothetical protein
VRWTLRLANASLTGSGALSVTALATLGGSGTIAGASTISGTLSPGSSTTTGILSFSNSLTVGGTTHLEIAGVDRGLQYDAVTVNLASGLTFGGSLLLDFTSPVSVGEYNLFDFSGTTAGDFASVTLDGLYSGGLTGDSGIWTGASDAYTFTFSESNGNLTVIPEPGTFAILASLGALGLARRRVAARPIKP